MDNSAGEKPSSLANGEGTAPEKITYSSDKILSNSIAGRNKGPFHKADTSASGATKRGVGQPRATSTRFRSFIAEHKKISLICGSALVILILVGVALLWIFVWGKSPELGPNLGNTESEFVEEETESENVWREELDLLSSEAGELLVDESEESVAEAKKLYEYELENYYPEISKKRVDVILNYATTFFYADRLNDVAEILAKLNIDDYKKPDGVDELSYVYQKLDYYALMRDTLMGLGMTEEADKYDQKVAELTNEEDKLAGEKEGVEETDE